MKTGKKLWHNNGLGIMNYATMNNALMHNNAEIFAELCGKYDLATLFQHNKIHKVTCVPRQCYPKSNRPHRS